MKTHEDQIHELGLQLDALRAQVERLQSENATAVGQVRYLMLDQKAKAELIESLQSAFDANTAAFDLEPAPVAAVPAMVPLTRDQMEKGRDQIFSINNPYCPCDSKTFRKVAEWVEAHHGVGLTVGK